jgi:ribonuclease PH
MPCFLRQRRNGLPESSRGKVGGRTHEIQRLIGRSLRAVTDLNAFGERTVYIDCDVSRPTAERGLLPSQAVFVALGILFQKLLKEGLLSVAPFGTPWLR